MPGRSFNSSEYSYGFNGKLKDDEIKGSGNSYDFGARIYDPRLGRWLSVDPLAVKYPFASPYNFALNTPIQAVDPDGEDVIFVNGYRMGKSSESDRGRSKAEQIERKKSYWNNVNTNFTSSVGTYFNDNKHHFLNASYGSGSPATERQTDGYYTAMNMIKSGELILEANNPITLVGHSQGNAFIAGMADAIKDAAWQKGIEVDVNLVMLSVHQPEDIKIPADVAPRCTGQCNGCVQY
ncbi:MAG: hypothetical protein BroJett020_02310 [Bacteroidota bacterium]|nr:MAG: hypothetical protein BroJett020_02310 [Bacteroidota bacterium]